MINLLVCQLVFNNNCIFLYSNMETPVHQLLQICHYLLTKVHSSKMYLIGPLRHDFCTNSSLHNISVLVIQELFYEDRHYHEHCFRCFRCDHSLADEPFTSQDDALLCNDCYCNEFSSKCVACDKTVMPGMNGISTHHQS